MAHAMRTVVLTPPAFDHESFPDFDADRVPKSVLIRKYQHQHPQWRLRSEEKVDWTKMYGTVLDASYSMLPDLRPILAAPTFKRLTVICLKENGVVDIGLLGSCTMLVHLDLSSNDITDLVGGSFWACFRELLVLLLHGNKIIEWQAVGGLRNAPQLTYLTLFFNPVCQRKLYRTFTANCCESLRGLDLHAVSDEEVVEGSKFPVGSRWRTCSSALALPQPLFKGLTEVAFPPDWGEEVDANGENQMIASRYRDFSVLASVLRRVELLRKFHARNSPVIVGQRQIRRFFSGERCKTAASRINTSARRWIVKLRADRAMKIILRQRGELYLVQEMLTPAQLHCIVCFQQRIIGYYRMKVAITCAQIIKRFMRKAVNIFIDFVAHLERFQVEGVIVASDAVGDLASVVAHVLMVYEAEMSWEEATLRTETMITTYSNCRVVRPFSFISVLDWSNLEADVKTDGVFVTRSGVGRQPRNETTKVCSHPSDVPRPAPQRPLRNVRAPQTVSGQQSRTGVFGCLRMRDCLISRRGVAVRRFCGSTRALDSKRQLWVFRPEEGGILARVVRTLRNRPAGKPLVPFILERHLSRCASATRIQAAWRGHVLRWNLLETLASCLIVARAGLCIQRWWRYTNGLAVRLNLCRRLWALAADVFSPTMYMELDSFFTLTRGWQWVNGKDNIAFTFQSKNRVASVKIGPEPLSRAIGMEAADSQEIIFGTGKIVATEGFCETRVAREPPMWSLNGIINQVSPSEVHHGPILRQAGAILTKGVQVKRVVWPVATAAVAAYGPSNNDIIGRDNTLCMYEQRDSSFSMSLSSASTGFSVAGTRSGENINSCPGKRENTAVTTVQVGSPVDLRKTHGDIEMLELTFQSIQEARARALLLAIATQEPGLIPTRPIAQLMTLGMLRRAAAGEPGQASPILEMPEQGLKRDCAVEMLVLKLAEGGGGTWLPGRVDRRTGNGKFYKVTLDSGRVNYRVPESCLRPYDRTGKEHALVEMSHLPSCWQRDARCPSTPADTVELELFRRSLPYTDQVDQPPAAESPNKLLREKPAIGSANPNSRADSISTDKMCCLIGPDVRGIVPGIRLSPTRSPVRHRGPRISPRAPLWAGSQTVSVARCARGLAASASDRIDAVPSEADKAAVENTWVPGNRFRRDLEKLVYLAARESQGAIEKRELSARRETVSRARNAEHFEPTPRERLESLKAADVAVFRREFLEKKVDAAFEKARETAERSANAADARGYKLDCSRLTKTYMETRLEKQVDDIKDRDAMMEEERLQKVEQRHLDVEIAKARAMQRRADQTKQASRHTECNTFASNTSQLTRYLGKYATKSHRAQTAGVLRKRVKEQKSDKQEMRWRMLKRVQELQKQKRAKVGQQRKTFASRARARVTMDKAVLRDRLGQLSPSGLEFPDDVMQVLRPWSRPSDQPKAVASLPQDSTDEYYGGDPSPWCEAERSSSEVLNYGIGVGAAQQKLSRERSIAYGSQYIRQAVETNGMADGGVTDPVFAAAKIVFPSKPDRLRPHSHPNNNCRYSRANDVRKTVVVLASVPAVEAETRPRPLTGKNAKLFGPKRSHSMPSNTLQHRGGIKGSQISSMPPDQAILPWPLGRRKW